MHPNLDKNINETEPAHKGFPELLCIFTTTTKLGEALVHINTFTSVIDMEYPSVFSNASIGL